MKNPRSLLLLVFTPMLLGSAFADVSFTNNTTSAETDYYNKQTDKYESTTTVTRTHHQNSSFHESATYDGDGQQVDFVNTYWSVSYDDPADSSTDFSSSHQLETQSVTLQPEDSFYQEDSHESTDDVSSETVTVTNYNESYVGWVDPSHYTSGYDWDISDEETTTETETTKSSTTDTSYS